MSLFTVSFDSDGNSSSSSDEVVQVRKVPPRSSPSVKRPLPSASRRPLPGAGARRVARGGMRPAATPPRQNQAKPESDSSDYYSSYEDDEKPPPKAQPNKGTSVRKIMVTEKQIHPDFAQQRRIQEVTKPRPAPPPRDNDAESAEYESESDEPQILKKENVEPKPKEQVNVVPLNKDKPADDQNMQKVDKPTGNVIHPDNSVSPQSDNALPIPGQTKSYRVTRAKGKYKSKQEFQIHEKDKCLMHAISKNPSKSVTIQKWGKDEAEGNFNGFIKVSKRKRKFILYEGGENGKEIMFCNVSSIKKPLNYDRFFTVEFRDPDFSLKTCLPKKRPEDGLYTLNFQGRFTKKSIKNSILQNDNEEQMIIVRRIGEIDLEVDASARLTPLQVFGYAIASWICPY